MKIFDEINDWSAEELLSRINLPLAKDKKSYQCPLCDNGTGSSGDGIKPRNSNGRVRWKCWKCGVDFSNFDLAAAVFGYDSECETAEAARRLKDEFNLQDDNETFSFSRSKKSSRSAGKSFAPVGGNKSEASAMGEQTKSATTPAPKNYGKTFYPRYKEPMKKFLAERGGSYRGLKAATFEKFGVVFHPEFGVEEQEKLPTLIIPYDDYHFVARAIDSKRRPTQHGNNAPLYEPLPLDLEFPNFIVEGELDCLSIVQEFTAFGSCIATGGAGKWRKVVPELEKRFANAECKPSFIVIFDNDETGKTKGATLVDDLKASGYPAEIFFFEERMAGEYYFKNDGSEEKVIVPKVDANDLLQKGGNILVNALLHALERTEEPLKAQRAAMSAVALKERQAEENRSGIKTFSFAEYFSAQFFSDIALTAKYSNRKTGFSNIDERQIFMPGVYFLGGLPATGKTSFAWQMLNQLADGGENCIYFSLEMSALELFAKSMTRELFKEKQKGRNVLALSSSDLRSGAAIGKEEVYRLAKSFSQSAINLRVKELSSVNVTGLIKHLSMIVAESEKPPVVVVDYLQILPTGKDTAKMGIDDALLRLKDFQRATNSTLIIISSFNRENYFEEASFKAFKESGAIEYGSDSIWALQNHGVDAEGKLDKGKIIEMSKEKIRLIKFSCLKNRNGSAYDCFFRYYAAHDYFEPLEEKEDDDRPKIGH